MGWLRELFTDPTSTATACLLLSAVIAGGFAVGSVRVKGVRLGVAGVLFVGLAFGHFGLTVDHHVLEFAREFGLVLFVFTLGLAVGPGFLNAFRLGGLRLNLLALGTVLIGAGLTVGAVKLGGVPVPVAVGLYSGATTNTPSLAAATQALREAGTPGAVGDPGVGYAVAYPFGVVGIILSMLLLRGLRRADPVAEAAAMAAKAAGRPTLDRASVRVTNPNLAGLTLAALPAADALGVVVSRVVRGDSVELARPDLSLAVGDVLVAVGPADRLDQFRVIVGERVIEDAAEKPGPLAARWLTVSKRAAVGWTADRLEAELDGRVQVTRVRRAEVELPPVARLWIQMGDQLRVVGPPDGVSAAARLLGDAPKELDRPELAPLFVGLAVGVIVGGIPFVIPGLPAAVKLGLAGGPLVVALLLAQLPRLGPLVWYLPPAGNLALREVGISLFLAAVGLKSGEKFVPALTSGDGVYWLVLGAGITVLPLLLTGLLAGRAGIGFVPTLGLLAGSMTDPPALAFAHAQARSDLPSVAYASVYPLTMISRILSAQLLALTLS